jgi:uncharacterized protein YfaS (alpha-2-macroglobulin family)
VNGVELIKFPLHERKEWQDSASFGMRKVLGARALGGTLGFRVKGDEDIHYEARLRYAPAELPRDAVDHGFAVDKRVTRLAEPVGGPIHVGDRVLVDVLVVAPLPRDHVVIDDPSPGGLVAGKDAVIGEYRVEFLGDRAVATFEHLPAGITHFRYVAEAAFVGLFVVPPTRVTSAYEPEVFGTTPASTFEVTGEAPTPAKAQ